MQSAREPSNWMTWVLRVASVYNILWGAFMVLFPLAVFRMLGMAAPNYPEIWQCVGMIVGVYGLGYWIAARESRCSLADRAGRPA